jgi:hypothetical protein
MESRFVFLGDEFFRTGKLNALAVPTTESILALLNGLAEMLEHSKRLASSGKGKRLIHFNKSFITVNNIIDYDVFTQAWKKDPAIINRLTFLEIPKDVEEKITTDVQEGGAGIYSTARCVKHFEDRLLKAGINKNIFRKWCMLAREYMPRIDVDFSKRGTYIGQTIPCDRQFNKGEKFYAFVKAATFINLCQNQRRKFPIKGIIHPTDADYRLAVELMDRVIKDSRNIIGI